mmetsp:Transcript_75108/g.179303  ORF Transcript_75108/g.179303 Transcript_75108/m.179303 type:complete len:599 (-) Transcript_75108:1580-3376(-)
MALLQDAALQMAGLDEPLGGHPTTGLGPHHEGGLIHQPEVLVQRQTYKGQPGRSRKDDDLPAEGADVLQESKTSDQGPQDAALVSYLGPQEPGEGPPTGEVRLETPRLLAPAEALQHRHLLGLTGECLGRLLADKLHVSSAHLDPLIRHYTAKVLLEGHRGAQTLHHLQLHLGDVDGQDLVLLEGQVIHLSHLQRVLPAPGCIGQLELLHQHRALEKDPMTGQPLMRLAAFIARLPADLLRRPGAAELRVHQPRVVELLQLAPPAAPRFPGEAYLLHREARLSCQAFRELQPAGVNPELEDAAETLGVGDLHGHAQVRCLEFPSQRHRLAPCQRHRGQCEEQRLLVGHLLVGQEAQRVQVLQEPRKVPVHDALLPVEPHRPGHQRAEDALRHLQHISPGVPHHNVAPQLARAPAQRELQRFPLRPSVALLGPARDQLLVVHKARTNALAARQLDAELHRLLLEVRPLQDDGARLAVQALLAVSREDLPSVQDMAFGVDVLDALHRVPEDVFGVLHETFQPVPVLRHSRALGIAAQVQGGLGAPTTVLPGEAQGQGLPLFPVQRHLDIREPQAAVHLLRTAKLVEEEIKGGHLDGEEHL